MENLFVSGMQFFFKIQKHPWNVSLKVMENSFILD